jgi:hypothetical protein
MITVSTLSRIIELVGKDEQLAKPFETLLSEFRAASLPHEYFTICCSLLVLLQDRHLLSSLAARCICWYWLISIFSRKAEDPASPVELSGNPFLVVFLDSLESKGRHCLKLDPAERYLLSVGLSGGSLYAELSARSPLQLLSTALGPVPAVDSPSLRASLTISHSEFGMLRSSGIFPVLPDPIETHFDDADEEQEGSIEATEQLLTFGAFESPWIRVRPPVLPWQVEETLPLPPQPTSLASTTATNHTGTGMEWSQLYHVGGSSNSMAIARAHTLMQQALEEPLKKEDLSFLLESLRSHPLVAVQGGLNPARLPSLVEKNPVVAVECLLKRIHTDSIHEYFDVLAGMEMSLNSMEVVNQLMTSGPLPPEFIHRYISNCMLSCQSVSDSENKYLQNRMVRLVCVFLQALIRGKVMHIREQQDLFVEVQAFCIKFSRIKEAASLFRMLKSLEGVENGGLSE